MLMAKRCELSVSWREADNKAREYLWRKDENGPIHQHWRKRWRLQHLGHRILEERQKKYDIFLWILESPCHSLDRYIPHMFSLVWCFDNRIHIGTKGNYFIFGKRFCNYPNLRLTVYFNLMIEFRFWGFCYRIIVSKVSIYGTKDSWVWVISKMRDRTEDIWEWIVGYQRFIYRLSMY